MTLLDIRNSIKQEPYYEDKDSKGQLQGLLYCADCLEILPQIPDKSVDLVLTDPPYGINYYSGRYKNGNPHLPIKNNDDLFLPLLELWRILKETGALFSFNSFKNPIIDDKVKNQIIWVKNNWTAGDLTGNFANQYESIAFIPKAEFKLKGKRFSNVWYFDRVTPEFHPTQKPVDLITRIIKCGSINNDLILDPFLGSGTTAIACKMLQRKYIGIEINPQYCDITIQRLKAVPENLFK